MKNSFRHYGFCNSLFAIVAAIMTMCCFFSCSKNVSSTSLTTTLDEIDSYISQGQTEDALKLLDKTDNKSLSVNFRLGICRRYLSLGETKRAEKLIKSCLKNHSDNPEILAVYSSMLLKNDKLKEALDVSKKLSGTQYGSFYAEALLKTKLNSAFTNLQYDEFCSQDYVDVYFDAYSGSKDNKWLRNVAIINFIYGKPELSLALCPSIFQDSQDAYFWSLVFYDNKKYVEASENLKVALDLVNHTLEENENSLYRTSSEKKLFEMQTLSLKIRALLADSYINLSEEKLAENERNSLLQYLTSLDEETKINDGENSLANQDEISDIDILSVIYLNSAIWALSRDDIQSAYKLLSFEVEKWPDYVPGLIAYGNFAYNSSLISLDDSLTQELRKLGIKSMDMEAYDNLPKIPVQDALARMEDSLARFKNFQLYVAKLDLEDKIQNYSDKAYLAKIYNVIERNTLGTNIYPPEIARYAIHGLLTLDYKEEAENFFRRYISKKYDFAESADFYDVFFYHIHEIDNWEIEIAAWFAADSKKASLAYSLYDYLVYVEYLKEQKSVREISVRASTSAMMNLAMIQSSTKRKEDALFLYGKISGLTQDFRIKSEAFYRIGVLYNEMGKIEDSIKSLKYAIYLNPAHSKARLLLSKIRN